MAIRIATLALLVLALSCNRDRSHVRIATGMPGGTFLPLGRTLARGFALDVRGKRFEAIESPGSVASLEMIERGDAELALISNHAPASSAARLIAVLYEETLQVVVRADAGIEGPFDLRGKVVAVGPRGSGTESIADTVLRHFAIPSVAVQRRNMTPQEAADALAAGTVDAAFVVAGMRTPIVDRLLRRGDMRLLSLGDPGAVGSSLEGIRLDAPYFAVAAIPAHAYGRQPTTAIGTITVRALLVARAELSDDLVHSLTSSLFDRKVELATEQQLLSHLTEHFDAGLSPYAVHPGADAYYRRSEPTFVQRYTDQISLGITVAAILWSSMTAFRTARRSRRRDRVEARFKEVQRIAAEGRAAAGPEERAKALQALRDARDNLIGELAADRLDANESFVILQDYLEAQIADLRAER